MINRPERAERARDFEFSGELDRAPLDQPVVRAALFCRRPLWNTLELLRAVEELQREGMQIIEEQLVHVSPIDWEHINLTGDYVWDLTVKGPHTRQA